MVSTSNHRVIPGGDQGLVCTTAADSEAATDLGVQLALDRMQEYGQCLGSGTVQGLRQALGQELDFQLLLSLWSFSSTASKIQLLIGLLSFSASFLTASATSKGKFTINLLVLYGLIGAKA
ncbi:hypothetical protein KR100_06755 [Synechococcus sp. KORDI-100]|nr:hypothetical protein KR100_06755 [Synechococcus sp. KORDI-100]